MEKKKPTNEKKVNVKTTIEVNRKEQFLNELIDLLEKKKETPNETMVFISSSNELALSTGLDFYKEIPRLIEKLLMVYPTRVALFMILDTLDGILMRDTTLSMEEKGNFFNALESFAKSLDADKAAADATIFSAQQML